MGKEKSLSLAVKENQPQLLEDVKLSLGDYWWPRDTFGEGRLTDQHGSRTHEWRLQAGRLHELAGAAAGADVGAGSEQQAGGGGAARAGLRDYFAGAGASRPARVDRAVARALGDREQVALGAGGDV
jgi:hypothetical protein